MVKCKVCGEERDMQEPDRRYPSLALIRKRSSVFLEMARVHFYKHKLNETLGFTLPDTDLVEPQLFAGDYYE